MAELLAAQVGNNTVYIETEPIYGFEQITSYDKAGDALECAGETITSIAMRVTEAIATLVDQPAESILEFAIKFNAQGLAIVSRTSTEAHLKITMTYKRANEI